MRPRLHASIREAALAGALVAIALGTLVTTTCAQVPPRAPVPRPAAKPVAFPPRWQGTAPTAYLLWARIAPPIRTVLAARYEAYFTDPAAPEYGFCGTVVIDVDSVPVITAVTFARDTAAGPNSVKVTCPAGQVRGHAHPAATCYPSAKDSTKVDPASCRYGESWGFQCTPSPKDVGVNLLVGGAMEVIQCDAHAFVFYRAIPPDLRPLEAVPVTVPPLTREHHD